MFIIIIIIVITVILSLFLLFVIILHYDKTLFAYFLLRLFTPSHYFDIIMVIITIFILMFFFLDLWHSLLLNLLSAFLLPHIIIRYPTQFLTHIQLVLFLELFIKLGIVTYLGWIGRRRIGIFYFFI